ncbi:MAG: DUF3098 domain-containing protein [Bacteroidetes bacterium]|nr:DUF3098 domain-containing protein [Bacteroidota bacterium]
MAKVKQKSTAQTKTVSAQQKEASFVFGKENYKLMLIGIAVVAIGMLLMIGGASDDPNKMSDEIFSFRRLTLAPIVIIGGYVVVLLAIIKKPKE